MTHSRSISATATRCTTGSSMSPTQSDYVTVSWNMFATHDKVMLIGNSDSATEDREHLRVTLHHNLFDDTGQRTPRVRFGKVHVYNNVYRAGRDSNYRTAGARAPNRRSYAENNYFQMSAGYSPDGSHRRQEGHAHDGSRQLLAGTTGLRSPRTSSSIWNEKFDPDLSPDAGWTPSLYGATSGPETAGGRVQAGAR